MLSATNSIKDVKSYLEKGYSDFDFESDGDYENALTRSFNDVEYLVMYPVIGSNTYSITKDKDKVDLTEKETYLYYAELYYTCVNFLKRRLSIEMNASTNNGTERLQIEGYEYEVSQGDIESGGIVNKKATIKEYYDKAVHYMCLAGHNPHALKRGDSIFAERDYFIIHDEIV